MPPDDTIASDQTWTPAQFAFMLKQKWPALAAVPNDVLIQKAIQRRPELAKRIVAPPSEEKQAAEVQPRTLQQARETIRRIPREQHWYR